MGGVTGACVARGWVTGGVTRGWVTGGSLGGCVAGGGVASPGGWVTGGRACCQGVQVLWSAASRRGVWGKGGAGRGPRQGQECAVTLAGKQDSLQVAELPFDCTRTCGDMQ